MAASFHIQLLLAIVVPTIAELDMKFTKFPESVVAPLGDKVTFECEVNVPGEQFLWRWKPDKEENWTNIDFNEPGRLIIAAVPGRSTKLEVEITIGVEESLYQCVIKYGAVSLTSVPARLTVARLIAPNKITADERVIIAPTLNTLILHCKEPISEPRAVISWWKEEKGHKIPLETPHGVLVIHNATTDDSGLYSCRATNELSGETIVVAERTHLKVQSESRSEVRFLEGDEYVGVIDEEGVLTMPVKPNEPLRLWCGAVSTPPPKISWHLEGEGPIAVYQGQDQNMLAISPFSMMDEGVYSCTANDVRRSWKVIALRPPHWDGNVSVSPATEGAKAHMACGNANGQPPPEVYWVLNGETLKNGDGIEVDNRDLIIENVKKRHAGIVQCFACNTLGCEYGAAMFSVVPLQIPNQDYSVDLPKQRHPIQTPKRHNRKNPRKHKPVLIPPSKPNVTRLSDESVMITWSHENQGLPIRFFKVQYRELSNSSNIQWETALQDIPSYIHSYQLDGLSPDKYYKFRIAAVYSNQDNKQGKSSARFHLQRGGFKAPRPPILFSTVAMSPTTIKLEWKWSSGGEGEVEAEGFYVYYRAVESAGAYEKVTVPGAARGLLLDHLSPDTGYDIKVQAYTAQAASDFSIIKTAKTLRPAMGSMDIVNSAPTEPTPSTKAQGGGALVTAGGALGAAALLVLLTTALLLCRRARRPTAHKEKGNVTESGGNNGYIPAKVPITITANPMHSEAGDANVEMSFLHNNNTGNNEDSLSHTRKNGTASRQFV